MQPGFVQQRAQTCLSFALQPLPAPEEQVGAFLVEQGAGFRQPPAISVDQRHHCEQQGIGRQPGDVGSLHRRLQVCDEPLHILAVHCAQVSQLRIPCGDEVRDLLLCERCELKSREALFG
ncbi:MAG: hypothetical protein BWY25_02941 [Chloroflexi bacterium ADurb.Bin222]|nr:MAG: hypothetical protein BWY25_02941 [Chloroflexi bacterium ADurb.Bin222]